MKNKLLILITILLLSGCSTVNFSSKYYALPTNYEKDIDDVWMDIMTKVPLKYQLFYFYKIVKDDQTFIPGMPETTQLGTGSKYNIVVNLPENFVKYVYKFYYSNHKEIIACLFSHELGHIESEYIGDTPEHHFLCDKYAMQNLLLPPYNVDTYYSMLIVLKQYRDIWNEKGDLTYRISKLKSEYPSVNFCFQRN